MEKSIEGEKIYTVRLIRARGSVLRTVLTFVFIFAAVWGSIALAHHLSNRANERPPFHVTLDSPAGATTDIHANGDWHVVETVTGPERTELRVYNAGNGRYLGSFDYPTPKPAAEPAEKKKY